MSNEQLLPPVPLTGLIVNWASNTTLTMNSGTTLDSGLQLNIVLPQSVTINAAVNGANGLDTGTLAASTYYYVYVIASSLFQSPTAAILSLSSTGPQFPQGYDIYKLVDVQLTDGSSHFVKSYLFGNGSYRKRIYDSPILVLNTVNGSATFVALSLASWVPPISQLPILQVQLLANTAGNVIYLRPTGSTSTVPQLVSSPVANTSIGTAGTLEVPTNSSQSIDYQTSSASDRINLWITGYEFYI